MSFFPRNRFQWKSADISADLDKLASITVTDDEINAVAGLPANFTITPAAGASTVCEITIQANDANNDKLTHVAPLLVWLSDDAAGVGLTTTAASGNVQAKAGSTDLSALTAKKALLVQTSATGVYVLSITDSSKTLFKVCVQSLGGGVPAVATLTTDDYGA